MIGRLIRTHAPALGTDSGLEVQFQKLCRAEDLPAPLTNIEIAGFEADAYWPDCNLVVELDSHEYHRTRGAFERDRAKDAALRIAGKEIVRFTERQTSEQPKWVAATARRLRAQRLALLRGRVGSIGSR